jgi:hypothetical protein
VFNALPLGVFTPVIFLSKEDEITIEVINFFQKGLTKFVAGVL